MFVIECEEKGKRGWVWESLITYRLKFTESRACATEYPRFDTALAVAKRAQEFWDCTVVELEKS